MRLETRLREYRQARGLDQAALAALVGVRRETIGRLEKGQYNPSLKLAQVFGARVEDLFAFREEG